MLKLPSGFASQPSNTGATFCPVATGIGIELCICPFNGAASTQAPITAIATVSRRAYLFILPSLWRMENPDNDTPPLERVGVYRDDVRSVYLRLLLSSDRAAPLAHIDLLLEVLVVEPDVADPRERHVIDRALAEAGPVLRIGVVLVGCAVVVPTDHAEHRTGGQQ